MHSPARIKVELTSFDNRSFRTDPTLYMERMYSMGDFPEDLNKTSAIEWQKMS